ncbi:hypothetical protein VPH35_016080 [Triticum aestivum]
MASAEHGKKLRVLIVPFFATSHIGPHTDLAVRHAGYRRAYGGGHPSQRVRRSVRARAARPVRSEYRRQDSHLPVPGHDRSAARAGGAHQGAVPFFWNATIADEVGVPCITISVVGLFSRLAMRHLRGAVEGDSDCQEVIVPGFPGPEIRIPRTELPEFLRCQAKHDRFGGPIMAGQARCFGLAVNTFSRAYFVGPVSLPLPPAGASGEGEASCISWLGSMPRYSVVYVCFGTYASISNDQLVELALGLEASGKPFLWALRAEGWAPPAGWEERVGKRACLSGEILAHPAVGAFLTHCGSSSLLEAAAAGVPMLTWPLVFDQFIEERLVTDVLKIGERVWDGPRSMRYEEQQMVPAAAVARAIARFLEPGGTGKAARGRAQELAVKAHAAVAEGGSSYNDLHRLITNLMETRKI